MPAGKAPTAPTGKPTASISRGAFTVGGCGPRSDGPGSIPRIVVQSNTLAFALFNRGGNGFVLRQNGLRWETLDGGLPDGAFYAMDTDWTVSPKPLFVATDDQIYVTRDDGDT